jgi:hypothetical protein
MGAIIAISSDDGKAYPYNGDKVADPTTAPTIADGAAGTFKAGAYLVQYTYVTEGGESLPSQSALWVATDDKQCRISAINSIPDGVTHVNVYVNGAFEKQITVTANATAQTDFNKNGSGSGKGLPRVSTAFEATDELYIARGILSIGIVTDASGNITFGDETPGEFREEYSDAGVFVGGVFKIADLELSGDPDTGTLTADAVEDLGRIILGDLTDGLLRVA